MCLQAAFEQVVARFPQATARLMEGMTRRLAAASTARAVPTTLGLCDGVAFGQSVPGAAAGQQRGEIVTIALVPAGAPDSLLLLRGARSLYCGLRLADLEQACRACVSLPKVWFAQTARSTSTCHHGCMPAGVHGSDVRSLGRLSSQLGRTTGAASAPAAAAAVKRLGAALKVS